MNEFIFGTLATTEKRIAYARARQYGVHHHHRTDPRAPQAGDAPTITVTVELDRVVDRVQCLMTEPEERVFPLHFVKTEWDLLNWRYYQKWQATLPPQPNGTLVRYQIEARFRDPDPNAADRIVLADEGATFSYLVGDPRPPDWTQEAIVYQIFPDRFYPGDGRTWQQTEDLNAIFGGTLQGIIDKLDYIADLGFNCIWLNPFFPDHTHHGYHATDYFAVNPRLGSMEDIRQLVEEAHRRGIRLLLDFVANHWGSGHETFQTALNDPDSEYYHWYHWEEWPHQYGTFFGVKDLPQVNVDHPDARTYLLESVRFWLGDVGFDGLRLDYVLGPSHDFWTALRAAAREVKPDAWIFGEAVDTPEMQLSYEGRFDGCLDFLLTQAMRNTFGAETMDLPAFDAFLNQHEQFFPPHFSRPSFLDNHDMNRFLFLVGGDKRKLKLAALCQFTLAGPPIVYNGTEVGVAQEYSMSAADSQGMAECRQPMLWGEAQDSDLYTYYQQLIALRHRLPVLRRGRRQTVHLDEVAKTYAYIREKDEDCLLIVLNMSNDQREVTLNDIPLPREQRDLLGQADVQSGNGQITVRLAPHSGALIG